MNDTCFGINNEGQLVFDYYHEDTDTLDGANVYNGQNSTLWCNFREAYADEIQATYQQLRNDGLITYDLLEEQFITKGSDKWSESVFNEDGEFKYVSMVKSDDDASNLPFARGDGEQHFRYFIENRLNYLDSKWYASDYANDYVSLRIYTPIDENGSPRTDLAVPANADITVTPYSDMYAGVRYKANGTLYQEKVEHGTPITFEAPDETFNDTETAIYGASLLSSLGDLAPLYCGTVNVSMATKLTEIKIGDGTAGYSNNNLKELSVGTNKLLKKIDIQNCPSFTSALGLKGCQNIEEIYAKGSGITGVELADSGYLKIVQLPATIANLTMKNQEYIEEFSMEGYGALKTVHVENCPEIDTLTIIDNAPILERVRLTGVEWEYDDASFLYELMDRNLAGIDENGSNTDNMWIDGTCHIGTLTGTEMAEINSMYPYLTITYDNLTADLIFMSEDGQTELCRQTIANGGNGTDPIGAGTITTPTKESTAQYDFAHSGWSLTIGGEADANALLKVEADRYVYAYFTPTVRNYTVSFYIEGVLKESYTTPYNGTATFAGSTAHPTDPDIYEFVEWKPSPANITGDTNCHAQYYDTREITDDWATIEANVINGTATTKYVIGAYKPVTINYEDGTSETIDVEVIAHNHDELCDGSFKWESVGDLPCYIGSAHSVVYNDEIHIFNNTNHYKYNGTEWVTVGTTPMDFVNSSAAVYNNEIHMLGGTSNLTAHYKYDGTEWTEVETLSFSVANGCAVTYNGELHVFGGYWSGGFYNIHWKYNGTEWTQITGVPRVLSKRAVVYNDEIHAITNTGGHCKYDGTEWISVAAVPVNDSYGYAIAYNDAIYSFANNTLSKYNGTEWVQLGTLPFKISYRHAVVYNNEIHLIGGNAYYDSIKHWKWSTTAWVTAPSTSFNYNFSTLVVHKNEIHMLSGYSAATGHCKFDGTEWISNVSTLPYSATGCRAVSWNNEIHIFGGSVATNHYKWDGSTWSEVSTIPITFGSLGCAVVYDNAIHLFGSNTTEHYKWDGTSWTEVSTSPYATMRTDAVVYNGELHILGGENSKTSHYKWNGTEWTQVSTLPVGLSNPREKLAVYNNEIHILYKYNTEVGHYKWDGVSWTYVSTPRYTEAMLAFRSKLYTFFGWRNVDVYQNPKATLTFFAKNALANPRKMNSTKKTVDGATGWNNGGWELADLRTYLNGDFYTALPTDLQSSMKSVIKYSDGGTTNMNIVRVVDKLFVPSLTEINYTPKIYGEGETYPVFTDDASRQRSTIDGTICVWWTRSTFGTLNGDYWMYVMKTGKVELHLGSISDYVCFGFCI